MVYQVKTPQQERHQQRRYRAEQDRLFRLAGVTREFFLCLEGIVLDDDRIVVWAQDEAQFPADVPPASLIWSGHNGSHWEYWFVPIRDEFEGGPYEARA